MKLFGQRSDYNLAIHTSVAVTKSIIQKGAWIWISTICFMSTIFCIRVRGHSCWFLAVRGLRRQLNILLLILLKPTYFSHEKAALQESASGMQHVKSYLQRDFNNKNSSLGRKRILTEMSKYIKVTCITDAKCTEQSHLNIWIHQNNSSHCKDDI